MADRRTVGRHTDNGVHTMAPRLLSRGSALSLSNKVIHIRV